MLSKKVNFVSFSRVFIMIVLDVSHSFVLKTTLHTSSLGIYEDIINVWLVWESS